MTPAAVECQQLVPGPSPHVLLSYELRETALYFLPDHSLIHTHLRDSSVRSFEMLWTPLLAFAALTTAAPSWEVPKWMSGLTKRQGGTTMLRFGCAQVTIDRLDPLVNPGQIPSTHQHQIVGGNGFNASMTTGDVSKTASCTTCAFSKDLSNYWTANMYFKARNGTYKRVRQLGAA